MHRFADEDFSWMTGADAASRKKFGAMSSLRTFVRRVGRASIPANEDREGPARDDRSKESDNAFHGDRKGHKG